MILSDFVDTLGALVYGIAALAVPGWFLLLLEIRRLNETVFDPDWRAARDADQRRIKAWQQWDEEMRAWKCFEADLCRYKLPLQSPTTPASRKPKPDSRDEHRHAIMG
jgi:hypothetical protein